MSSNIVIDFNNLKYNLYEILNVPSDSDEKKIKKSFTKIVKSFHPDKNSELEDEIYYHIIISNQILLNSENRRKYDEYLSMKSDDFNELKSQFNKTIGNIDNYFSNKNFNEINNELNKKHKYNPNDNEDIMKRFEKITVMQQNNRDINIVKENIRNNSEFNEKFTNNKISGKYDTMLIVYNDAPQELSTYVNGENYTNLSDLSNLYIEDSVQTNKYSSLDRAFLITS
jgi:DnaJ-class molecular chaperone